MPSWLQADFSLYSNGTRVAFFISLRLWAPDERCIKRLALVALGGLEFSVELFARDFTLRLEASQRSRFGNEFIGQWYWTFGGSNHSETRLPGSRLLLLPLVNAKAERDASLAVPDKEKRVVRTAHRGSGLRWANSYSWASVCLEGLERLLFSRLTGSLNLFLAPAQADRVAIKNMYLRFRTPVIPDSGCLPRKGGIL
jgi:hypothetical protein